VLADVGLDHKLGVYNNNVNAVVRALVERSMLCEYDSGFAEPIQPDEGFYDRRSLQNFARKLANKLSLRRRKPRAVVEMYHGPKKRIYLKACEELESRSITARDAMLKAFVKFEKQDVSKAPRIINPRTPLYNLLLACFLKRAEKLVYKVINMIFGGHTAATVIKGMDARKQAAVLKQKWDQFSDPVAVGLDAKKFDMHVSVPALNWEHAVYVSLFPGENDKKDLRWLLRQQLRNRGVAYLPDGKVKFSMHGTRCSGDINTSLGNCLIMCALVHAFSDELGIRTELANNGDDCVVFMERSDLTMFQSRVDAFFLSAGFKIVAEEPCFEFDKVEFCQTRPVFTGAGWVMVRNHSTVLKKDLMCLLPIPNIKAFRKWLGGVGECGLSLTRGVPVLEEFYTALKRVGLKPTRGMIEHMMANTSYNERKFASEELAIIPEARYSYSVAFGIEPAQQKCIEEFFETLSISHELPPPVEREALLIQPGISLEDDEDQTTQTNEGGQSGPSTAQDAAARNHGNTDSTTGRNGRGGPGYASGPAHYGCSNGPQPGCKPEPLAWIGRLLSFFEFASRQSVNRNPLRPQNEPVGNNSPPRICYVRTWSGCLHGASRVRFESGHGRYLPLA
jgi:hypothetical protein